MTEQTTLPALTIFAVPKPFLDRQEILQRNAIGSWLQIVPPEDILLFGNAEGTDRIAVEFGLRHFPELPTNEFGTPLLTEAFSGAFRFSRSPHLMYANADIVLPSEWKEATRRLLDSIREPFLAIGRRVNAHVDRLIHWQDAKDVAWMRDRIAEGQQESILCKDFFIFPRGWFVQVPPFAVGRGNWDSWMVTAAKRMRMKVIDISPSAIVVHQIHSHEHVSGGQRAAYVHGPEARSNQSLAGGRHWIRGSTADWVLEPGGLRPRRLAFLQWEFWADLPRALRLARRMN